MSLMLTEPKAFTSGNYALEAGGRFYRQRTGKVRAIVMHVTAGLQDLGMEGTDESAEGTNRWALNSGAQVSWHRIADSDGVERCLPSWATAWHAEGYNSNTVGEEISNVDARWDNKPADWVTWTLWWAAVGVADWVVTYKVPLRRATQAELDRAIATDGPPVGFIDHSRLSTNRRDPGATFPWDWFFTYVAAVIDGATSPEEDDDMATRTDKEIAAAVLTTDGVLPTPDWVDKEKNPYWPASEYITRTYEVGRDIRTKVDRLEAQLGANSEALKAIADAVASGATGDDVLATVAERVDVWLSKRKLSLSEQEVAQ